MLKHKIERFLTYISMQMPALMSRSNYAGAEIFDGMAVLEFKLPKPCDVGDLLGRVVGCCHIFPLPWSAGVVIPFLGEGVSAHNFQKTLYRQPAFDTTYTVSRIITV